MNTDKTKLFICVHLCLSVAVFSFATGCGRYAKFTLPEVSGGDTTLVFRFVAAPEPVIARGEFQDALNPSVVFSARALAPVPVNLYSVFDGHTWHTAETVNDEKLGIILSPDPKTWEGDYIAANGSAVFVQNGLLIWYWYVAGPKDKPRIGLAKEAGEKVWRKEPAPVLDVGPVGSWDERAVADPYVIRIEPYFYMYYLGQDRAVRQRIGVARSGDGVHWEKLRANPVVEMDEEEAGIGEPAVWQSHGFYWMLYTVRDFAENRYLRLARSTDGVRWTKLAVRYKGTQAWNSKVICDPTVVVEGERILVWFGGGDVASPDENLHGQIGFATLAK
jgi:Glycosyl hydrolases family 32 N-terminal domain